MDIEVEITIEGKKLITFSPKSGGGGEATVDGPVTLEVVEGDCSVGPAVPPNDLAGYIISSDEISTTPARVRAYADGKMGEEVLIIERFFNVHSVAPHAQTLDVTIGAEEPK